MIGDYRSNSLIVQASPRDLEEVAELLRATGRRQDRSHDRSADLSPEELRGLRPADRAADHVGCSRLTGQAGGPVKPALPQQPGQQNQNQVSRSVQIVGIDQAGNKIIESGLLTDVTISADDNSNALVVKAPSQSMGLIAALDRAVGQDPGRGIANQGLPDQEW